MEADSPSVWNSFQWKPFNRSFSGTCVVGTGSSGNRSTEKFQWKQVALVFWNSFQWRTLVQVPLPGRGRGAPVGRSDEEPAGVRSDGRRQIRENMRFQYYFALEAN